MLLGVAGKGIEIKNMLERIETENNTHQANQPFTPVAGEAPARPTRDRRDREKLMAQVAAYLDEFMWRNNYTEERFAEETKVDRSTISRILNKKNLPYEATLSSLARVCGVGLFIAAGYTLESLPKGFGISEDQTSLLLPQTGVATTVQIPDLADPELAFYLRQLGQMPEKTREIIKGILRSEANQLRSDSLEQHDRSSGNKKKQRPDFARPVATAVARPAEQTKPRQTETQ